MFRVYIVILTCWRRWARRERWAAKTWPATLVLVYSTVMYISISIGISLLHRGRQRRGLTHTQTSLNNSQKPVA